METALLVIDYINGIMNGSCKDYANKYPIVTNTNKLITGCRSQAIPIYFVRLAFNSNYSNLPKHSHLFNNIKQQGLFQLGSHDCEFSKTLDFRADDHVINKTAASPFHSQNLTAELRSKNIEQLIFAGVATDNAINIGAREAHDAGYYTTIVEDACGASSEDFHRWSIAMLEKIVNEIVSVDKFLKKLAG